MVTWCILKFKKIILRNDLSENSSFLSAGPVQHDYYLTDFMLELKTQLRPTYFLSSLIYVSMRYLRLNYGIKSQLIQYFG